MVSYNPGGDDEAERRSPGCKDSGRFARGINPVELEGTFPLPEAQLDRFLLKVTLGYPSEEEEADIILRFHKDSPLESLSSVLEGSELLELQRLRGAISVEVSVTKYILSIVRATRHHPEGSP